MRSICVLIAILLAGCGAPDGQDDPGEADDMPDSGATAGDPTGNETDGMEGDSTEGDEADAPMASEGANETRIYARTFPLAIKETESSGVGLGENGGNCVGIQDGINILGGNATLSWDATSVPEELRLVFWLQSDATLIAEATGPSPVSISFEDVSNTTASEDWPWPYLFSVHPASEPAAVADVVLDITFEHEGLEIEDVAESASCSRSD